MWGIVNSASKPIHRKPAQHKSQSRMVSSKEKFWLSSTNDSFWWVEVIGFEVVDWKDQAVNSTSLDQMC